MPRIQNNILAGPERRVLDWLCRRLAGHISSDQLTLLGLLGAALAMTADACSVMIPALLWLAVLGYVLHWFGDSLDGSMARYLKQERPRYGYFLDHSVDALGNLMIMLGLGFTTYVRMDVSLFTLVGYLLLSIHVFLKQHALGEFRLSFLVLGPTELRIGLIGLTLGMLYFGNAGALVDGFYLSVYDMILAATGIIFLILFLWFSTGTALALRRAEG